MPHRLAGLSFQADDDRWELKREFPFWKDISREAPAGVRTLSVLLPDETAKPTVAQRKALEQFLKGEAEIAARLQDALVRWIKRAKRDQPDRFEEVSAPRSVAGLGKIIDLSEVNIVTEEVDGIAAIHVSFSCDWDVEHGGGVLLWNGQVIECGGGLGDGLLQSGPFSKVCNDAERRARDRYLQVHPPMDSEMTPETLARLQEADRKNVQAAQSAASDILQGLSSGPAGVRAWNQLGLLKQIKAGPYRKLDLSHLKLDGIEILENDFSDCVFDGSTFDGADLRKTKFAGSTFRGATLGTADLAGTNMDGCDFSGAKLNGVAFNMVSLKKARFQNADLIKTTFMLCRLQGVDFSGTAVGDANFTFGCEYNKETGFPPGFNPMSCSALELKK